MLKRQPDATLEEIYLQLKDRKLVRNTSHFMREYVAGTARSMFRQKASTTTLVRLWSSLNERAQFDLAIRVHHALVASAQSPQPSQGVQ